jgi:hypothetical protein
LLTRLLGMADLRFGRERSRADRRTLQETAASDRTFCGFGHVKSPSNILIDLGSGFQPAEFN